LQEAEIQGRFEGNLVVRKRLLIKASGRVSGTIRYDQIEIECGGQIRRRPGATVSGARRDPRGHTERARRELTRHSAAASRRAEARSR
jgi:cytoskeletal protein CcmA (bactofilin family)